MSSDLGTQQEALRHLTRIDPDPRVRRRAHALLLLAEGHAVAAVARLFATAPHRVRAWRARFLAKGRQGLADKPRTGRPPKLEIACGGPHGSTLSLPLRPRHSSGVSP